MYEGISLNVNGIAEKPKRDRIFDFFRNFKADFYLLQETHNDTDRHETQWTTEWGGQCMWSRGTNRSRGVAILLPPGSNKHVNNIRRDTEGRVLSVTLTDPDKDTQMNIINVYAPNNPRERQVLFENLWQYKSGETNLILAGDFNYIKAPELDKQGGNPSGGSQGIRELNQFVDSNDLIDTWRKSHPQDRVYTWHSKDFTLRSRLDRWYVPGRVHPQANLCVRACPHSDHSVAEVTLRLDDHNVRGKGVWKLNNALLMNGAFLDEIRAFLEFWKDKRGEFQDLYQWWDEAKVQFKEVAIIHAVRANRNHRRQEVQLTRDITELKNMPNPDKKKIDSLEQQIIDIINKRLEGARVRSRAAWMEDGEKPTKFFFDLERKKQAAACITKLIFGNRTVSLDRDILDVAQASYQELYTDEPVDIALQDKLLDRLESA